MTFFFFLISCVCNIIFGLFVNLITHLRRNRMAKPPVMIVAMNFLYAPFGGRERMMIAQKGNKIIQL